MIIVFEKSVNEAGYFLNLNSGKAYTSFYLSKRDVSKLVKQMKELGL